MTVGAASGEPVIICFDSNEELGSDVPVEEAKVIYILIAKKDGEVLDIRINQKKSQMFG